MTDREFESLVKRELGQKSRLPQAAEAALFERAEAMLVARRERRVLREAAVRHSTRTRARRLHGVRQGFAQVLDFFALHPDMPATAATFATLALAFLFLHGGQGIDSRRADPDLSEFAKTNDAPARYDAQRLAERQAYEREVEDAHQKTSGGI